VAGPGRVRAHRMWYVLRHVLGQRGTESLGWDLIGVGNDTDTELGSGGGGEWSGSGSCSGSGERSSSKWSSDWDEMGVAISTSGCDLQPPHEPAPKVKDFTQWTMDKCGMPRRSDPLAFTLSLLPRQ